MTFRARPASFAPTRMTLSSPYGSAVISDILVGDVWVIGGQSNAELNLAPCLSDTPEIAARLSENDPVRLFRQTQSGAAAHTEFHRAPARDVIDPAWRWSLPSPEAARSFSAIGYYTARILAEKTGVPVGAVMMCAGGACLRELMPEALALSLGYTEGANVPVAGYYNTLISPLLMPGGGGLQFRGQIFFQGESEGIWPEMADSYDADLAAFVADERARFGHDFPFYNVQLSSYREEGERYFPHLRVVRHRQARALSLIPDSFLAVSRDLGSLPTDPDFAHSPHKYALSRRIAAQILAHEYGIGDPARSDSPMPVSARYTHDRRQILVTFSGCGEDAPLFAADPEAALPAVLSVGTVPRSAALTVPAPVTGFSAARTDGTEIPLAAETALPDTVRVFLPEDGTAEDLLPELRYAVSGIAGLAEGNLCGGGPCEGALPVPSFAVPVAGPRRLVILTDIGDTIIDEGTEVREGDTVVSASCIPGAKETFLALFREGFPIVMNADGLERSFRNTMAQNGLDAIFSGRAVSETVGAEKPDKRMFLAALRSVGLTAGPAAPPEDLRRAVMIGNNVERDIAGANRMGIRSVLLTWSRRRPFDDDDSPADRHPTWRAGTPEELLPLMLSLEEELKGGGA